MNSDIGKIMGRNLNPLWPIACIRVQEKLGSIDKKNFLNIYLKITLFVAFRKFKFACFCIMV